MVRWGGTAWLLPGIGLFHGRVGSHDWHHHLAHQIVVGDGGDAIVESGQGVLHAHAILIPAGQKHRLSVSTRVLSLYLDPLAGEARALGLRPGGEPRPLALGEAAPLLAALAEPAVSAREVRACIRRYLGLAEPVPADPRLARVIAMLADASTPGGSDRAELARRVHLSPERFSHWFAEQTGLALRSYRKWLRLLSALERIAAGGNLTEAAHAAGFSDSAHLSRTFRTLFGTDPTSALSGVRLKA